MFEQFSQEKSRSGLSANEQLMRLNEQFPEFNIQCMFPIYFNPYSDNLVHRKCMLSSLQKMLGIVSVHKNNSMPEQHVQALLDIKLMILLVGGVSLRCGNAWQTLVYLFLSRHSPPFLGGYYI